MDLFIYSDESGVFDKEHNEIYVYGGLIFLGKEQKDIYARKYIAAEKVLRGQKYTADEELKACRISNKEKGKLYRSMNGTIRFGVIVNQKNVLNRRRDPILLERTVYAFGLLEAIARVGMPFVFKGGTSLILLMDKPRRLSTDIDIIVAPGTDIDYYIDEASKIFPFLRVEEQIRIGRNNIEKRHFKFTYDSHIGGHELYILLDVLFEDHHYEKIVHKDLQSLKYLKKTNPLGYAYIIKADEIMG